MNKLTIIGNLTADPELRTIPSGVNVCTFTVAVNSKYRNEDGSSKRVDYFRIAAWRGLGDNCARYLSKGKKVCVVGEVSARAYEAKDGTSRASLEVTADEIEFLTPKGETSERTGNAGEGYQRQYGDTKASQEATQDFEDVTDDDLPF